MNELLIYGPIWSESARLFVESFAELEGDSVTLRINTDGGGPEDGWSMIARFAEFQGSKSVKVDGKAYSMGAFVCLYADTVDCLDVSQFLFHRAAYSAWYESEYMDEPTRVNLINVNKKLREAFEAKIDVAKFEALKVCKDNGITVNRLFSMDERVDVYLTADEAKKIGLVKNIVKLTPQKAASINAKIGSIKSLAASANVETYFLQAPKLEVQETPQPVAPIATQTSINNPINNRKMTIAELQAQHPDVYAQVLQSGIAQERERVGAWNAWHEIDSKRALEGIASGNPLTQKDVQEFTVTAVKSNALKGLEANANALPEGATAPVLVETPKSEAEKNIADLTASILGK